MPTISLRLSEEIEERLNNEAKRAERARSEVVREAIVEYIDRHERERFMAEIVTEAQRAYSDPAMRQEALDIAEEAIETGNEAMDIAEGREAGEPWPEETGERWWR